MCFFFKEIEQEEALRSSEFMTLLAYKMHSFEHHQLVYVYGNILFEYLF